MEEMPTLGISKNSRGTLALFVKNSNSQDKFSDLFNRYVDHHSCHVTKVHGC